MLNSVCPVTAKCVNRSRPRKNLARMQHTLGDAIFVSRVQVNPLPIDDQGVAALHHEHVLVVVMHMSRRRSRFMTLPECHLASIDPIKHVTFHTRRCLARCRDSVCRSPHELRKIIHLFTPRR